jgi:hypothetical protein
MTITSPEPTPQEYAALVDGIAAAGAGQLQSLAGMTPDQINTAREEGRLDRLLGADEGDIRLKYRAKHGGTIRASELARLKDLHLYDEIQAAHIDGRITYDEES